jgi:hypothetical protein
VYSGHLGSGPKLEHVPLAGEGDRAALGRAGDGGGERVELVVGPVGCVVGEYEPPDAAPVSELQGVPYVSPRQARRGSSYRSGNARHCSR